MLILDDDYDDDDAKECGQPGEGGLGGATRKESFPRRWMRGVREATKSGPGAPLPCRKQASKAKELIACSSQGR